MPIELSLFSNQAASVETANFWTLVSGSPLLTLILVLSGILIGLFLGFLYSFTRSRFSKTQADRKLNRILANFEQEKDTSETILRELEVGIIAYGGDGKLITVNPSATSILEMQIVPQTLQSFLSRFGSDNGIQAALVLQTPNITGVVNINDRTVRIRLTQSQLSAYHKPGWIIIIQDITEQEREEKQRKEFVANVSHELKTPLTTISAYSETLLDWGLEGKPISDVRTDIIRIHDDAQRMDNLVQNLLLLSSIDSRGIRAKMSQYDIVAVMKQVVSQMQVHAVEKQIQLDSFVLSIIPPVYGDPSAIDRILTNLISNGIKYTDHRGYVSVSVQLTNDYISLKVVDNGMGVSKDNLPRLFDRFYRVDSTGSRKYGGTGLGLSIAKELTELQGGTISVASVLGKGTEFVITIPKAEKTYRETLAAIHADVPRSETVYENAEAYLLMAAAEIDIQIQGLAELKEDQTEDLLSYLLAVPAEDEKEYPISLPSDLLPARFEAVKRSHAVKDKSPSSVVHTKPSASAVRRAAMESSGELLPGVSDKVPIPVLDKVLIPVPDTVPIPLSDEVPISLPDKVPAESSKPAKQPISRSIKNKHAVTAEEHKIITIDQLQSERLKGEKHV